ncbi:MULTISPECIES: type I pullulanase [unclassified Bacillus (in: firmicutes)]|uniref:type I pullulanase n=1 Tax=unclassified Bacillus (in: firmicutes) TaxID=185979 RepID=UPI0008E3760D|nr:MULTISPECIES: type I pullulanase [unclassified Bacillus (in: firmicutes)]SFB16729.1 pullulanase, type I [Bacillus sp. UNCCL13]SFQ77878.1 pullulanase, type I [Bacillus sp. cl95]
MRRILSLLLAFVLVISTFSTPLSLQSAAAEKTYEKVVLRGNAETLDWGSDNNPLTYDETEGNWKTSPISLQGGKEVEYKFVMDGNWMSGENLRFTPPQTGDYIFVFYPENERKVDVRLDFSKFTGKLTLDVTLPAGTPEWITPTIGSSLNGFNYAVTPLTKTADGKWTVTLAGNENESIEYLYSLGDAKFTENRTEKRKATFTKEGTVYQDSVEKWSGVPVAKDVKHDYSISPAVPSSNDEVEVKVTVKHYGTVDAGAVYFTTDGKLPKGARGTVTAGNAVSLVEDSATTENGITTTIFKGIIPKQANDTPVKYIIDVWDQDGAGSQFADSNSLVAKDATSFAYYVDDFQSPQWAKDATIYHIFVDRFNDGDVNNNRSVNKDLPYDEQLKGWMGGDLKGIQDKLDYISDLGVNTIWISPVFKGPYSHGYHPKDFKQIDDRFGDPETMKELIKAAHAKNIKVVYDFVANHTSNQHSFFQDALTKGKDSPYYNWYSFEEWPNKYKTFYGISELPELNNENPEVRNYMINDVVPYWLTELDFDGFRLDYAKGPSYSYWVDFRHKVKQTKPNAFIFGEIWDSREKINSYAGELDGALDFVLNDALVNTFAKNQSMTELSDTINANIETYPKEYVMSSFLDSHDKPRFIFEAGGDVEKLKLAASTQLTLPGAPVIYYGDEVGLSQSKDHNSVSDWKDRYYREFMVWDEAKQNQDLKSYYKKLISLRNKEKALRTGDYQKLFADQNVLAYEREDETGKFLVVVNKGSENKEIDVNQLYNQTEIQNVTLTDALGTEKISNDAEGDLTFTSEGKGFEIYEVEGTLEYSDQPLDRNKVYNKVVLRGSAPLTWSEDNQPLTYDSVEKVWKSNPVSLTKGEKVEFKFVRDEQWLEGDNLSFVPEFSDKYVFVFHALDQRKIDVRLAEQKVTTKVKVHYQPKAGDIKDWNLWVWAEGKDGKAYPFTGQDSFGKYAEIELDGDHNRVGFIVRTDSWEKDGGDRWIEDVWYGQDEVWIKAGDDKVYLSPPDGEYRDLPVYDELEVTFNYYRYDLNYKDWDIWVWTDKSEGQALPLSKETSFGKQGTIKLTNLNGASKVGFIVRKSDWSAKDIAEDRYITDFTSDGKAQVWLAQGQKRIYDNPAKIDRNPRIIKAAIDELNKISFETNFPFAIEEGKNPGIVLDGAAIKSVEAVGDTKTGLTNKVTITTEEELDLARVYKISKEGFGDATVTMGKVIGSQSFEDRFYYAGSDLGNTYSKEKTKFRLWAPTASEAKLVTYEKWDSPQGQEIAMTRAENGTWTAQLNGDQKGLLYTYKVKIGDTWNEAVDPYVRAVAVNGDKGAVVDLSKTTPKDWKKKKPIFNNPEDAIIYETHVRDLTIQAESGVSKANKGKFLGVAEKNTKGPNGVKTGLSHIKDLGVTHVQFIPMYDYNTASVDETKLDQPQYNWGYDPKNYNVPEGSYSTDPYSPTVRINEMKQMIQALHDNQLRVVMDVVYNHMFNAFESNFHKLVPGYYYRYNDDGTLANGTGVGNDTASEHKMMRKFIVDSVTYWAKEYNIDGFRFDLMGIHDVETMNQVRAALDKIDPSIIVIGEGWDLNTPLDPAQKANQKNASKMDGIAHFNDDIRDGLKGSVFEEKDNGFINGKSGMETRIKKGVVGGITYNDTIKTFAKDPEQTVTYVEAHDNHTLWDKLKLTNGNDTDADRKKMHKLASSIILTSQGVSFVHAGQEFMRTKNGDHNSYKSPDSVNQLDWKRRSEFNAEVEYFKGLVKLRKAHKVFRLTTEEEIKKKLTFIESPKNTVAFALNENKNGTEKIAVAYNANRTAVEVKLPAKGNWHILVNGEKAGNKSLGVIKGDKVTVPPLSTYVLELNHDGTIHEIFEWLKKFQFQLFTRFSW